MSNKAARKAALDAMTKNYFERIYLSLLAAMLGMQIVVTFHEAGAENISAFVTVYGVFALSPVLTNILMGLGTFLVEVTGDE